MRGREGRIVARGAEVGAAQLVVDVELLHGSGHGGDAREVFEHLLALRALDEGPEVWHDLARDAAALVGDADDDVVRRLADCDLDGRRLALPALGLVVLDDGVHGVAEELANNVLEVVQDVGEAGGEVALDADLGDGDAWAVGRAGEGLDGVTAARDDVASDAAYEDFADEVGLRELGARGEVGGVESRGESKVLLCDYAAGYPLR